MNQINAAVPHPIAMDKKVMALRPSCPCKGATFERVEGIIKKVIHNQTGYWYYLSVGITIKADWVQFVF